MLRVLGTTLLAFGVLCGHARAQVGSSRYSSIVIDANSGNVLLAANPDEPRYPASLTKMMTLYMLFEALRDRRITLEETVPVSEHAASMSPSKLGLVPGTRITVEQAILGLVTKSANDAAVALAELMGGDEQRFAQMMTLRARALGMTRTVFRNASGLPDPEQVSTAHDMAVLARHLVQDFPSDYHYFSVPDFVFHGRVIPNHDHMLITYPGADGLKTGYTQASGFNLVSSALRSDVRLIGVVFGASSGAERSRHMAALLDAGFARMDVAPVPRPSLMARLPSLVGTARASTFSARIIPASARFGASAYGARRRFRIAGRHALWIGGFPVRPRHVGLKQQIWRGRIGSANVAGTREGCSRHHASCAGGRQRLASR